MVKVEDRGKGMDCVEGCLMALLRAEKANKEGVSKKLALIVKELDAAKAELEAA